MKLKEVYRKYRVDPDAIVTVRIEDNAENCNGFIAPAYATPAVLRDKECVYFNTTTNVYTVKI